MLNFNEPPEIEIFKENKKQKKSSSNIIFESAKFHQTNFKMYNFYEKQFFYDFTNGENT